MNSTQIPQDTDYKLPNEIIHSFAPPEKQASIVIIGGVSIAIIFSVSIFVTVIGKIKSEKTIHRASIWNALFPVKILNLL